MIKDALTAVRALAARPGFTLLAVATLALGIGATTLIFSVTNAVLFRPLPYGAPDRLVAAAQTYSEWLDSPNPALRDFADDFPLSYPVYLDWHELSPVFEEIGVYTDSALAFLDGDRPERIHGAHATHGIFTALGVAPQLGRPIVESDDVIGATPVVILSDGLWRTRFGSDPQILGRLLRTDQREYTVVGVMPPEFYFPSPGARFWISFDDATREAGRDTQGLRALALLSPGVSLDRAQSEMEVVTERIAEAHRGEHDFGVRLTSYEERIVGDARPALLLFLGAVALVLVIACANIANLLLVRTAERQTELAMHVALGASRARLFSRMFNESLVLCLFGGGAGVLIAMAGLDPLVAQFPPDIPRAHEIVIDYRVLLFAVGLSFLTATFTTLLPWLAAARLTVSQALRGAGRSRGSGKVGGHFTEEALVIAEIALAFVLLMGALLVIQSFINLTSVERGFVADRLLTLRLELPESRYADEESQAFYAELLRSIRALPGVEHVASAAQVPMLGGSSSGTTQIERRDGVHETNVNRSMVTADYFQTLGIPMMSGRAFTEADREGNTRVALVSAAMANQYWPDPADDPIGHRVRFGDDESGRPWLEIVGIVGDVRHQDAHIEPRPWVYVPASQTTAATRARTLLLKTSVAPSSLASSAREAVWRIDPDLPIASVATLDELLHRRLAAPQFRTTLLTLMATLATVLAVVGIYGVMAHTVALRTREIGIRVALGARPADVAARILRRGARLTAIGLALGVSASLGGVQLSSAFLFGVPPTDPQTEILAATLVVLFATLASYLPARRASRVDPLAALKE